MAAYKSQNHSGDGDSGHELRSWMKAAWNKSSGWSYGTEFMARSCLKFCCYMTEVETKEDDKKFPASIFFHPIYWPRHLSTCSMPGSFLLIRCWLAYHLFSFCLYCLVLFQLDTERSHLGRAAPSCSLRLACGQVYEVLVCLVINVGEPRPLVAVLSLGKWSWLV